MLLLLVLLVQLSIVECRAYGSRIEYHYEYDPKVDVKPMVTVNYENLKDEDELSKTFFNKKHDDIRMAPKRFQKLKRLLDDVNFGEITQRNRRNGWTNGFESNFDYFLPLNKFYQENTEAIFVEFSRDYGSPRDDIKIRMEKMMRSHAEEVISSHFPDFLSRRQPPRHFYFMNPRQNFGGRQF